MDEAERRDAGRSPSDERSVRGRRQEQPGLCASRPAGGVSLGVSLTRAAVQVTRVLDMLRRQRGQHSQLGAPIDLYEHGLQAATRAHLDGAPEVRCASSLALALSSSRSAGAVAQEVIVAALLHDVGELLVPTAHGDVSASILRPYGACACASACAFVSGGNGRCLTAGPVSQQTAWILAHHEIFQLAYYGAASGVDPNVRERFKHEPHYAACVNFCEVANACKRVRAAEVVRLCVWPCSCTLSLSLSLLRARSEIRSSVV